MAWVAAADFEFAEGRYVLRWPDGNTSMPCLITIVDEKPLITISIMGVAFYADPVKNEFYVQVADAPPAEDPDQEHQIEDDEQNPPPPTDSPFAGPEPEPLPGPPATPDGTVVHVEK